MRRAINRGEIHIVEPALAYVVKMAVEGGWVRRRIYLSERPMRT